MSKPQDRTLEYISRMLNSSDEMAPPPSWSELARISEQEYLSALLYLSMTQRGLNMPPRYREQFKQKYIYNWCRNTAVLEELSRLLPALYRPVILLKGASLLLTSYRDPGLRRMGDVDILVKREDVPAINAALIRLGYRPFAKLPPCSPTNHLNSLLYEKEGGHLLLHLHWHLVNAVTPNYIYADKINLDKLWEEAVQLRIGHTDTLGLAPHHQLLHLSEHAMKHSYHILLLLLDIHRTVYYWARRLDWKKLCMEAETSQLNGPLFYGLHLSKEYFGTEVPHGVMESLRPVHPGPGERAFYRLLTRGRRREGLCWLFYLSRTPGWRKKIKFTFHTLFPPRNVLMLTDNVDSGTQPGLYWSIFLRRLRSALRYVMT